MPYVPCRECLVVSTVGVESCRACGCSRPTGTLQPRARGRQRERWMQALVIALPLLACDSTGDPVRRQRYEADRERCERGSTDEAARKSCMVYRGWPDGEFR